MIYNSQGSIEYSMDYFLELEIRIAWPMMSSEADGGNASNLASANIGLAM